MNATSTIPVSNDQSLAGATHLANHSLSELVDHVIRSHHAKLRVQMPRALELVEACEAVRGPRRNVVESLGDVLRPMWHEMKEHIVREEQVVFPAIRLLDQARSRPGLLDGRISQVIESLEHDHELAEDALKLMSDLTNGFEMPRDAEPAYRELMELLATISRDLAEHTHVEEVILFPKARQVEAELTQR